MERDYRSRPVKFSRLTSAVLSAFLIASSSIGCGSAAPATEPTAANSSTSASDSAVSPTTITVENVGLETPESILYVEDEDIYLVSNINGSPLEKDNNGFISRVAPDGSIVELKWISGGSKDVTLNAPKGMVISDDVLYVSDIDSIRMFDKKTGTAKGSIEIPGSSFLNDLTASSDGTVYVSDTGWKAGAEGFEGTGTDAVFALLDGAAKQITASTDLHQPNGLLAVDDGIFMVTSAGELVRLNRDGTVGTSRSLPGAGLDGIVLTGDGKLLVSSWQTKTVYEGSAQGDFAPIVENVTSPADIGYDSKRNRVLIPVFLENKLIFSPLPAKAETIQ